MMAVNRSASTAFLAGLIVVSSTAPNLVVLGDITTLTINAGGGSKEMKGGEVYERDRSDTEPRQL